MNFFATIDDQTLIFVNDVHQKKSPFLDENYVKRRDLLVQRGKRLYVVCKGYQRRIYSTWDESKQHVKGFNGIEH